MTINLSTFLGTTFQGNTGIQGTQGVQGLSNQGTQGLQGTTGFQGTQGLQGDQGLQGLSNQGIQGLQGRQGLQGTTGSQGLQGLQGLSNQGVQGLQGIQGLQGLQGRQGLQGLSNQGTQGLQGTFGPPTTPENAQTSAYVLAASDNGKYISITTGGVSITTATAMTAGQNAMIFNNSASSQTITQGASVTLRYAGTASTGNRTLAGYGLATVLCVASNTYVISGAGLS